MRHDGTRTRSYFIWLCVSFLIIDNLLSLASAKPDTGTRLNSIPSVAGMNGQSHTEGPRAEISPELVSEFIKNNSVVRPNSSAAGAADSAKEVRVVYLVPSDRTIRQDYVSAIQAAIVHLQAFYQGQLGSGFAFSLHSPIVEVFQTSHAASFYSTGGNATQAGFWTSVLSDGFALSGGGFNDPSNRWIYYIDADPTCGQVTGGTSGVALLPANDLRGLTGQPNVPPCVGQPPDLNGPCRWVGGLGHELGHAFGLPHPPGCDQGTCSQFAAQSLMYLGYINYPNTYFLDADKSALLATGFFSVLSPLQAPDCAVPTEAKLETITVTGYDNGAYVEWRTGSEVDNLGFNIYREENGKRLLVNPQIVAGSALLTGSRVMLAAGRSYGWWDAGATGGAEYWVEDIDLNGRKMLHGPVLVKQIGGVPVRQGSAAVLSQVGITQAGISKPVPITAPSVAASPDQVKISSSLTNSFAGQPAAKLAVNHDGFYRVSIAELVAAGIDPHADPEKLQLYADGKQIPIRVQTDAKGQVASLEFYGVGLDTASTEARTYWLITGVEAGLRMQQGKWGGGASGSSSFLFGIERRDRTVYFSGLRNGEHENFFGPVIAAEPVDQTLTLSNLDSGASGRALVDIALQGVTNSRHRVWAYVNGTFVGELLFDGQSQGQGRFPLAMSQLREGSNVLRFVAQGGPGDVSLVDYTRISYWHKFMADDNRLQLTVSGGQQTTVSGFTNPAIRVFDVTNPEAAEELVVRVEPDVEPDRGGFSATFASARSGERRLLAITDDGSERPARINANRPSSLRAVNHTADLVIITRRDFFPAFKGLARLRASQGIKSELIDAEDIYDEFNFGNKSPQAVKDFLQYAKTNWKRGPRFVLLGADSSYDPKNYLGLGDWDIAPSKLIDTALMETASDDWFVDFNDDGLPELAVGRLPARSLGEATAMVAKLIDYEHSSSSEEMLLVTDISDTYDFAQANASLKSLIPPNVRINQIDRTNSDPATARSLVLGAINRGHKVVSYAGHGSMTSWRGELLTSEDARLMENVHHPSFFTLMTCLNGYVFDPVRDSLSESLIKAEGGAIAVWSSSGITYPGEQSTMNRALYGLLFSEKARQKTIGEIVMRAKEATSNSDLRRTWILIGDPTTKIR
jgi:hypothetical protein